jgi:hypothetical protein
MVRILLMAALFFEYNLHLITLPFLAALAFTGRGDINVLPLLNYVQSVRASTKRDKSPDMPTFTFLYRAFL